MAGLWAWIAHLSLVVLLIAGASDLGSRRVAVFILLWCAGFIARPYVPYGDALFVPYVATLDIVLVFYVFYGDVRL